MSGDVPSREALATENTYAFYDIHPAAPVHVLVIPRQHITNAAHLKPEHGAVLAEMMTTARAVAESEGIIDQGYRLVFNIGRHALNSVPHLHMHLLGGQQMGWPPGTDPISPIDSTNPVR
jgi:histidine triad (HIT) family protein